MNASEQTVLLTASEVRVAALDLLARREHSAVELGTKLVKRFRSREGDPDVVGRVVKQLVSDGLLSDQRFAVSRVRQLSGGATAQPESAMSFGPTGRWFVE